MSYRLRNFVIAGVLALLAGILTTTYVSHYKHKVQTGAGLVPVLVATKDASAGTPGKKIHSVLEKVEERSLVAGAVANPSKLGSGSVDQKLSVLLAVPDQDAQKLFFAMENGDWTLALRPIDGSAR